MNFTNLQYFLTVAKELNMTRAAKQLYISQQSLSGHIARVEEECGVSLFERGGKLKLTYAGECVARHAAQILDLEKQMNQQLFDIIHQRSGRLSIGVYHHRAQVFLSETLPSYHALYPKVELHLETGLSKDLEIKLLTGELELIVGFTPFQSKELKITHIATEHLCLLVPRALFSNHFSDPVTAAAHFWDNGVDIRAFSQMPFLLLNRGNRARDLADLLFAKYHISPNILLESEEVQTILSLNQGGMGATFVFELGARRLLQELNGRLAKGVYIFPFREEGATAELVIAYCQNRYLSVATQNFISLVHETFTSVTK